MCPCGFKMQKDQLFELCGEPLKKASFTLCTEGNGNRRRTELVLLFYLIGTKYIIAKVH